MDCSSCGFANRDTARFCGGCGAALPEACGACGAARPPGARFCDQCGAASKPPDGAYTPAHLVDRVLRTRSALEGERKQVTVLFCDVKDSTVLSRELDPEDWHGLLDRLFVILAEGVHAFEGTVNQYTGDGIMALFGAPVAHEDHAERACRAALDLQSRLAPFTEELGARDIRFATRIGINSGEVIVGRIGDDLRMDYTAQGHVVMLAKRMEEAAAPGSVYVGAPTAELVRDLFALDPLEPIPAKGVVEPVQAFELRGEGPARTRLEAARARGFSRFVGRDRELDVLRSSLDRAAVARGHIVGIAGPPGVGKSRLVDELLRLARARDANVQTTFCRSHARTTPLVPIRHLVRRILDVDTSDARALTERVAQRLAGFDAKLAEELDLALDLMEITPAPRGTFSSPAERAHRQRAFFQRLIAGWARDRPSVLFVDDLQWIDRESERLLSEMMEEAASAGVVVVLTFRPEYGGPWTESDDYTELPLAPLEGPDASALLDELLGPGPALVELRDRILDRTGGTPFYQEEVVRSLADSGRLAGQRGAYELVARIDDIEIPPTVESVLAARIDRLQEREKLLLQAASVLGRRFSTQLVSGLVELPPAEMHDSLQALVAAEFVTPLDAATGEYGFEHALTRDVAYDSQLRGRRAERHRAAAKALESFDVSTVEHVSLLAQHWEAGGEALAAARCHALACSTLGFDYPMQGAGHAQKILTLLDPDPAEEDAQRLRLEGSFLVLLNGMIHLGMSASEVTSLYREARNLGDRVGEPRERTRIERGYALSLILQGELLAAESHYGRAVRIAREAGDDVLANHTNSEQFLLTARFFLGRLREALEGTEFALAEGLQPRPLMLRERALLLTYMGRLPEARQDFQEALDAGAGMNVERFVKCNLTHLAWVSGEGEVGLQHAERALEIARQQGSDYYVVEGHFAVGFALLAARRWQDAAHALEPLLLPDRTTTSEGADFVGALLTEAYVELGRRDDAVAVATEAIEFARGHGKLRCECHAQIQYARALAMSGAADGDACEAALSRAARLIEETGAISYRPFLALARADAATGSRARRQARTEAALEFEAIGAPERAARVRELLESG